MLESAVGAAHCLALATLPNISYPLDIFPTDRFYREDLAEPPMRRSGPAQFEAWMAPGVGAEPHPARLEKLSIESVRLRA